MAADGALSVAGAADLVEPMRAWLASLTPTDTAGVLFTYDTHYTDIYATSAEAETFPAHCVRGSKGWANVLDPMLIDPEIPVWTLEKGVFDMWAEDGLQMLDPRNAGAPRIDREAFFNELKARGVEDMTVIGVAADYCVRWAIDGLVARGLKVEVPSHLTRGIERQIQMVVDQNFDAGTVTITA
jgi:nicotinamidase/pyrazinamidase